VPRHHSLTVKDLDMPMSSRPHSQNNSQSNDSEWDQLFAVIVVALAKSLGLLAWWSILFPMISIPALVCVWVGLQGGPIYAMTIAGLTGLGMIWWLQVSPQSFDQWVTNRLRSRWRTWWVYRHRWTAICTLHGLTATISDRTLVPTLRWVTIGATYDYVAVQSPWLTGRRKLQPWPKPSAPSG
jgi:DNA segregation ATPase FtsK/SpoIIIE, S-DNA-T family